uniref:Ycf65 n=1 Tax=Haramonas pauciplastida TaxID=478668 RepID=UPI002114F0E8|nr:Ycf65 [Haramonas pauciplastida]UTE94938.1 Ycf65 [Haramonas pauciplastida]
MHSFFFRIIWTRSAIGIALDKEISELNIQIPMTPYYFWPRTKGWDLLKNSLKLIPWLSSLDQITILNNYTKILHLWINSDGNLDIFDDKWLIDVQKRYNFILIASD